VWLCLIRKSSVSDLYSVKNCCSSVAVLMPRVQSVDFVLLRMTKIIFVTSRNFFTSFRTKVVLFF